MWIKALNVWRNVTTSCPGSIHILQHPPPYYMSLNHTLKSQLCLLSKSDSLWCLLASLTIFLCTFCFVDRLLMFKPTCGLTFSSHFSSSFMSFLFFLHLLLFPLLLLFLPLLLVATTYGFDSLKSNRQQLTQWSLVSPLRQSAYHSCNSSYSSAAASVTAASATACPGFFFCFYCLTSSSFPL